MPVYMLLPMLLYYLGIAAALYVAFRFVRAFERRGVDRAELAAVQARLAEVEAEVSRSAAEVRALEDGHRFTTRLLAERGSGPPVA